MSGSPAGWRTGRPLVCDTNVLLSALASDGATRALVVELAERTLIPDQVFVELEAHREAIRSKTGLPPDRFDRLLDGVLSQVERVRPGAVEEHLPRAETEMADVDPDDAVFLAAALAVDGTIWSDDAHLHEQDLVPVFGTGDVIAATDVLE